MLLPLELIYVAISPQNSFDRSDRQEGFDPRDLAVDNTSMIDIGRSEALLWTRLVEAHVGFLRLWPGT